MTFDKQTCKNLILKQNQVKNLMFFLNETTHHNLQSGIVFSGLFGVLMLMLARYCMKK